MTTINIIKFAVDILDDNGRGDGNKGFTVYAASLLEAVDKAKMRRKKDGFKERMKIHMLDSRGLKKPDTEFRFDLKLKGKKTAETVLIIE